MTGVLDRRPNLEELLRPPRPGGLYMASAILVIGPNDRRRDLLTRLHAGATEIMAHRTSRLSFESLYREAYQLCMQRQGMLLASYIIGWLRVAAQRINDAKKFHTAVLMMDDVCLFWRKTWAFSHGRKLLYGNGISYMRRMARSMKLLLTLDKHWPDRLKSAFRHWYFRAAPLAMAPGGKARKRDREAYEASA